MHSESLHFFVAPHIVQDLGINLYTTLPRVLVEFVANAHDADSPWVDVRMDFEAIRQARAAMRRGGGRTSVRLEDMELPGDLTLEIIDQGHGMSRDQVQARDRRVRAGESLSIRGGRGLRDQGQRQPGPTRRAPARLRMA